MNFCIECGEQLNEDIKFCTACGTPVKSQTVEKEKDEIKTQDPGEPTPEKGVSKSPIQNVTTQEKTPEPGQAVPAETGQHLKKPMSKKTKIIIGVVAVLLIALFGTHKWLTSYFDPIKSLVAMDEAVTNNDMESFLHFIEFDKDILRDNESFFEYIKEREWETVRDQYLAIIEEEKIESNPLDKDIFSVTNSPLFKVKQKEFFLGLYKSFTLHAIPTKLFATSNLEDSEVTIQNMTAELSSVDEYEEINRIYPGEYEVSAKAENEYGEFVYEDTAYIDAAEENTIDIHFESDWYYVSANYGYENAILFIDDKSTDKEIGSGEDIGPIPANTAMKIHAEWKGPNGQTVRSNVVKIQDIDQSDIYFEFDESQMMIADVSGGDEEVGQFVLDFRDAYENAVNYADYSEIEWYLKPDSHAAKELKGFIKDMGKGNYYYEFEENTVVDVVKKDDKTFEVETNEIFTFIDENNDVYGYDREKVYIVEIIDGGFQISKIDYTDTQKGKVK